MQSAVAGQALGEVVAQHVKGTVHHHQHLQSHDSSVPRLQRRPGVQCSGSPLHKTLGFLPGDVKGNRTQAGSVMPMEPVITNACCHSPLPGPGLFVSAEWGYCGTFDRENGGGFLTDHFPGATKVGLFTQLLRCMQTLCAWLCACDCTGDFTPCPPTTMNIGNTANQASSDFVIHLCCKCERLD
jgi:hypothetical protein